MLLRPIMSTVAARTLMTITIVILVASCGATPTVDPVRVPDSTRVTGEAGSTVPAPTSTFPISPGTTDITSVSPAPFIPAPASWRTCLPAGYQCASVEVPLDYTAPDGPRITLAVQRRPANDGSRRIGSLLYNPGGPGSSGVQSLPGIVTELGASALDVFDVVGFDPRGVGGSVPLTCDRAGYTFLEQDLSRPDPAASVDDAARRWGESCEEQNGPLLPHLGTRNVALDLESLRQALGDERLTYAGFSYGSLIGLVYAELFPSHIRAMLLDGVVDPTLTAEQATIGQSVAIDLALDKFVAWCPQHRGECPITGDAAAAIDDLYTQARDQPLTGTLNGEAVYLGPTLIYLALVASTYDASDRPRLARAIQAARQGDGSLVNELVGEYLDAASLGLNTAVNCLDSVTPTGAAFERLVSEAAGAAPRSGVFNANSQRPCGFWPVPPDPLPVTYRAVGSPPILVFGTTGDNATPYANAQHVAGLLEDAHLVTLDADRHAAIGANACVTSIQAAYLVSLTIPSEGTRC